jgi:serine protease
MTAATPPTAVVLNVTVTNPTAGSYLTVWPDGNGQPLASDLNFGKGQTRANLVVVKVGANGKVDLSNLAGSTDVIIDVVGWYI